MKEFIRNLFNSINSEQSDSEKLEEQLKMREELVGAVQEELVPMKRQGSVAIQQESGEDCSMTECSSEAEVCCSVIVPPGYDFLGSTPDLAFNTDCLDCRLEPCTLPVEAENPCNREEMIQGVMEVKRIRVTGCIPYLVSHYGARGNGIRTYNGIGFLQGIAERCCQGTLCVDQYLCVLPDDREECIDLSQTVGRAVVESIQDIPCGEDPAGGGTLVTIKITFTFPSCNQEPAAFTQYRASRSTICQDGTGTPDSTSLFGYVVDENGTPVEGAMVSFTVDDPTLGSVSPNPAMTDSNGRFNATFSAESNSGTATITAEVNGVEQDVSITVQDCS
ncbi:Ig-like domain-containing protein [Pontibacillus sp. ALD_SL1]|uniref:Ig-like domain-containing protein n=1 Tax=Pontibacillus sp. ALD_SL1 TaxID=2777185 RepID=UPI001A95D430|nr:invasin domain 3-containing protein [Pontibacillus sp. ALD_SL1]QST01054.1 Ig-like domain-containing protein [Pontibacillus sp. ALD_SL1]